MKLTVWTYEGPPHVGAMRVATAMKGVHYVLHAPQGDTYADLLFTMIERRDHRPPVTYTTFQARDLGSDTAELFQRAARDAFERFAPELMLVGPPLGPRGEETEMSKAARRFAVELGARYSSPVDFADERLTSRAAEDRFADLRAAGALRRKNSDQVDAISAQIILENWLKSAHV